MDHNHGDALATAGASIAAWELRLGYLTFLGLGPWPIPDGMVTAWRASREPPI